MDAIGKILVEGDKGRNVPVELSAGPSDVLGFSASEQPKRKTAKAKQIGMKEVVRVAKQILASGAVGQEYYDELKSRLPLGLLKRWRGALMRLGREHNGLLGTVYLDPSLVHPKCTKLAKVKSDSPHADTIEHALRIPECDGCMNREGRMCNASGLTLIKSKHSLNEKDVKRVAESQGVSRRSLRLACDGERTSPHGLLKRIFVSETVYDDEGDEVVESVPFDFGNRVDVIRVERKPKKARVQHVEGRRQDSITEFLDGMESRSDEPEFGGQGMDLGPFVDLELDGDPLRSADVEEEDVGMVTGVHVPIEKRRRKGKSVKVEFGDAKWEL